MDGGQIDDREKDGSEAACDGVVVPQVVDEIPVRVRKSYFVEVLSVESPNIDAMIKKAEETIERINEDEVLLAQKIRKRVVCEQKPKFYFVQHFSLVNFNKWRVRIFFEWISQFCLIR